MGRGMLVFKGDNKVKKKKTKTKHSNNLAEGNNPNSCAPIDSVAQQQQVVVDSSAATTITTTSLPLDSSIDCSIASSLPRHSANDNSLRTTSAAAAAAQTPAVRSGTGRITVSGTVVTGHKTKFLKEVQVGDALIVVSHNNNNNQNGTTESQTTTEMRVITMRISDTSLNISSAFSQPVMSLPFQYINKPRDQAKEARMGKLKSDIQAKEEEGKAAGLYGSSTEELVYRERTAHGSYRIKRVKVDGTTTTRGDLLEMRTKKKSDKYC